MSDVRNSVSRVVPWVLLSCGIALAGRAIVDWQFGGTILWWSEAAGVALVCAAVMFALLGRRRVSPLSRPRLLTVVGTCWLFVAGVKVVWHASLITIELLARSLGGIRVSQLLPGTFFGFYMDNAVVIGAFELCLSVVLLVCALQILRGFQVVLPIFRAVCVVGLVWVIVRAVGSHIDASHLQAVARETSSALLGRLVNLAFSLSAGMGYVLTLYVTGMTATRNWIANADPARHEA